jgi:uncharacterized protein YecE (DUF72 family)
MTEWRVGSSGFSYDEWVGPFYPQDLPAAGRLAWYAARLPSVEINNTFYRMPAESVLAGWAARVPPDFRFALKAPRRITHAAKDADSSEAIAHLFRVVAALGETLGPVLFQLPPWARKDLARLRAMLALVPAGRRVAFEFRHASWLDDEVYAVLRDAGAALCLADFGDEAERSEAGKRDRADRSEAGKRDRGERSETGPLVATAPFGYLRLRAAAYDDAQLAAWVETIRAQAWEAAFVFFKHEDSGTAPILARRMLAIAHGLPLDAEAPLPKRTAPPAEPRVARKRPPARRGRSDAS